jgi:hypothetical protein
MRRKTLAVLFAAAVVLGGAGAPSIVSSVAADEGGCPHEAAGNGAAHANAKSAHGVDKQVARGCSGEEPAATPAPIPGDEADVRVVNVSVSAPDTAPVETQFRIFVGVDVRNDGPADAVLADITLSLGAPPECAVSPAAPVTVEDTSLTRNVGVFVSVGWLVTCSQPGSFVLTADATATIDPLETTSDPNLSNNGGSGDDTTHVGS